MKRRLVNLFMTASLLLGGLCLAGWARSFWVADSVSYTRADFDADAYRGRADSLHSADGGIMLINSRSNLPDIDYFHDERAALHERAGWNWQTSPAVSYPLLRLAAPAGRISAAAHRWGFEHATYTAPGVSPAKPGLVYHTITFPWWLPTLIFVTIPVPAVLRLATRRLRRRRGLCLSCGYDRRATPQGGRCPECGTMPDLKATTAG